MGVAASAVQDGGSSGSGSEGATGGGAGGAERNASSVRYPTEASPHEPSLGGATATTTSMTSSLAPGSHASLGQRASGGWNHVRMSCGSHSGAARPASDNGGATRCVRVCSGSDRIGELV